MQSPFVWVCPTPTEVQASGTPSQEWAQSAVSHEAWWKLFQQNSHTRKKAVGLKDWYGGGISSFILLLGILFSTLDYCWIFLILDESHVKLIEDKDKRSCSNRRKCQLKINYIIWTFPIKLYFTTTGISNQYLTLTDDQKLWNGHLDQRCFIKIITVSHIWLILHKYFLPNLPMVFLVQQIIDLCLFLRTLHTLWLVSKMLRMFTLTRLFSFNFWSKTSANSKTLLWSCESSQPSCLINEQTGKQPLFLFLYGFNEACLKNTTCCSSYWSNIPQHLNLPNSL